MNKSKIEWCDMTWNPVTGCLHGCNYCYAKRIAERFGAHLDRQEIKTVELHFKRDNPYPYDFYPTFHRYRLDEPKIKTKGKNIFVSSMGDLFGDWVPDSWIRAVFDACQNAPQHNYIFLTKNPMRFQNVFLTMNLNITKNMWFGFSVEDQSALSKLAMGAKWLPVNSFISIEPIHGEIDLRNIEPVGVNASLNFLDGGQYWFMGGDNNGKKLKWVIVGAQTGPGAKPPKQEWIQSIINHARAAGIPIFLKDNLNWPEKIQEFPKGMIRHE